MASNKQDLRGCRDGTLRIFNLMQVNVSLLCQSVMEISVYLQISQLVYHFPLWFLFLLVILIHTNYFTADAALALTWGILEPHGHWSRTWCPARSPLWPHTQGVRPCCCTCLPVRSTSAVISGSGRTWTQHNTAVVNALDLDSFQMLLPSSLCSIVAFSPSLSSHWVLIEYVFFTGDFTGPLGDIYTGL